METTKKQQRKNFFLPKNVTIKLSQSDIYEIISGLWLQQKDYGWDAPNQQPSRLRDEFKKLISKKKEVKE